MSRYCTGLVWVRYCLYMVYCIHLWSFMHFVSNGDAVIFVSVSVSVVSIYVSFVCICLKGSRWLCLSMYVGCTCEVCGFFVVSTCSDTERLSAPQNSSHAKAKASRHSSPQQGCLSFLAGSIWGRGMDFCTKSRSNRGRTTICQSNADFLTKVR